MFAHSSKTFFQVNSQAWAFESYHKLCSRNLGLLGATWEVTCFTECEFLRIKGYLASFWSNHYGNNVHLCSEARSSLGATLGIFEVALTCAACGSMSALSMGLSNPYLHGLPLSVRKSSFSIYFCFSQCTPFALPTSVLFFLHA